jgi:transposase InsO family protein
MVRDEQVRLLRTKMNEGTKQQTAAAAAGMCERSARRWQDGPLPSETKSERAWRTRKDPFGEVWEAEIVPLLNADERSVLEATTVIAELRRRHGDIYGVSQLRTLQRRMNDWRTLHGPGKEVYFEQRPVAGREGAFDFTDTSDLGVTIMGEVFAHLLFQFVLTFSKWRWVGTAFSETFEAMLAGIQNALWALGGVPAVWRSDNLSAATHQLPQGGRELNRRYDGVLTHYGAKSTRIEPGESHQNGVVEKGHDLLKSALRQALVLRGSTDFESVPAYETFYRRVAVTIQSDKIAARFDEERAALGRLPATRLPDFTSYRATVRRWSTVHFAGHTYSVPSRLIDSEVDVHQYAEVVDVCYRGKVVERMPRIRGERAYRIDYRHVIWSLVRKPGAFARYRYREELFPSLTFRRTYDALVDARGERADVEYVRILHLAASTMQADVACALELLLARKQTPDYATVKALAAPEKPTIPVVHIPAPDASEYDTLLVGGAS